MDMCPQTYQSASHTNCLCSFNRGCRARFALKSGKKTGGPLTPKPPPGEESSSCSPKTTSSEERGLSHPEISSRRKVGFHSPQVCSREKVGTPLTSPGVQHPQWSQAGLPPWSQAEAGSGAQQRGPSQLQGNGGPHVTRALHPPGREQPVGPQ